MGLGQDMSIPDSQTSMDSERPSGRSVSLGTPTPLKLDSGLDLGSFTFAYQTYGRLNAARSNAVLIWTGTGPEKTAKEQWALRDIVPMVTDHFGVN